MTDADRTTDVTEPERVEPSGFDDVEIPVGGAFWRAIGTHGTLLIGYGLLAVHLVVVGVVLVVLGGQSVPYATGRRLAQLATISTAVLPLVAMTFIWLGEYQRRGAWGGRSGHRPTTLLPQGSVTIRLRLVSVRWNVVWLVVSGAAAAGVLRLAVLESLEYVFAGHLEAFLVVTGMILAAAFGTALGALVKKVRWLGRAGRAGGTGGAVEGVVSERSVRFWRWFSFRWRVDIWSCAVGAMLLWIAAWAYLLRDRVPDADDGALVFASAGLPVLAVGLWATTQFWRSGEDLAGGESVA